MTQPDTFTFVDRGPHAGQAVLTGGAPFVDATVALVLAHGRGASADDMLGLGRALHEPGVTVIAPQAASYAWYPHRFMEPIELNEPWLSSALGRLHAVVERVIESGIPANRVVIGGFSQGACLATEYAARQAGTRGALGGVLGFSGGLIGPPGTDFTYPGSLDGTPVFLGCSDVDAHIPKERVQETADVLRAMGAEVNMVLYPGMAHTIVEDEIVHAKQIIGSLL